MKNAKVMAQALMDKGYHVVSGIVMLYIVQGYYVVSGILYDIAYRHATILMLTFYHRCN